MYCLSLSGNCGFTGSFAQRSSTSITFCASKTHVSKILHSESEINLSLRVLNAMRLEPNQNLNSLSFNVQEGYQHN